MNIWSKPSAKNAARIRAHFSELHRDCWVILMYRRAPPLEQRRDSCQSRTPECRDGVTLVSQAEKPGEFT
jgi:hypothetical protein